MRKLFAPFAAACLAVSASTAALAEPQPDAAELAEAHAIIDIMFPPARRGQDMDKMMSSVIEPMRNNMPPILSADPGLKKIVDDGLNRMLAEQRPLMLKRMPELLEAMAIAYTHEFSLAELKDIHRFATTPAGGHYLSRSAALLGDPAVVKINTTMIADGRALSAKMLPELKEKIVAYLTAHPEVAAKLKAADTSK